MALISFIIVPDIKVKDVESKRNPKQILAKNPQATQKNHGTQREVLKGVCHYIYGGRSFQLIFRRSPGHGKDTVTIIQGCRSQPSRSHSRGLYRNAHYSGGCK